MRTAQHSPLPTAHCPLTHVLQIKPFNRTCTTGRLVYIDDHGQPLKLEDARTEPTVKFSSSSSERLDPGQETTESMDVEFPAEALKTARLKEIRVDLAYTTSPYREGTLRIPVSIGGRP